MSFTLTINNKSCTTAYAFVTVMSGGKVTQSWQPTATAGIPARTTNGTATTSLVLTGNKKHTLSGITATKDDIVLVNIVASNDPVSEAIVKSSSKTLKAGETKWNMTIGGIANYGLYVASAVFMVIFFILLLVVFIMLVRAAMKSDSNY